MKLQDKIFVSTVGLSLALVSFSVFYYFVIYIPTFNKHREEIRNAELEIKEQQQTKETQEKQYFELKEKCIDSVEKSIKELDNMEAEALKACWVTGVCNHAQLIQDLRKDKPGAVDWRDTSVKALAINTCIEKYLY